MKGLLQNPHEKGMRSMPPLNSSQGPTPVSLLQSSQDGIHKALKPRCFWEVHLLESLPLRRFRCRAPCSVLIWMIMGAILVSIRSHSTRI